MTVTIAVTKPEDKHIILGKPESDTIINIMMCCINVQTEFLKRVFPWSSQGELFLKLTIFKLKGYIEVTANFDN